MMLRDFYKMTDSADLISSGTSFQSMTSGLGQRYIATNLATFGYVAQQTDNYTSQPRKNHYIHLALF